MEYDDDVEEDEDDVKQSMHSVDKWWEFNIPDAFSEGGREKEEFLKGNESDLYKEGFSRD